MFLVGSHPKLILNFELYKRELTVAKRLIEKVRENYKGIVDVVVYDALACNSVWINQCIANKMTTVIHVKENNVCSIKEVKRKVSKNNCIEDW